MSLVQVLTGQSGARVVGPDERLAAGDVVQLVGMLDLVADGFQIGTAGELVKGDLVADTPIADREAIVGVPQHGFADTVVKGEYALLAFDHRGIRAPGHSINRILDNHVGRENLLVLAGTFQMHVAPEVKQDGSVQRIRGL